MSERENLARDIWNCGYTTPDLLAEYLIQRGWARNIRPVVVYDPVALDTPIITERPRQRTRRAGY